MTFTVSILFKGSSELVTIPRVKKFVVKYDGDRVTAIEWEMDSGQQMLYIDLSQIAFVFATEEK